MHSDVIIVGGGFAGAATAFHLSQISQAKIVVLEAESAPGRHASGRNAGMLRQPVRDSFIRGLTAGSRRALVENLPAGILRPCGSLLLGDREALEGLRDPALFESEIVSPAEAAHRVRLLDGHRFEAGLWTPGDCVVDVEKLLSFYVEQAESRGVRFLLDRRAQGWTRTRHFDIQAGPDPLSGDIVVNACGAWADRFAGANRRLVSYKRHLFILEAEPPVDLDEPFVWNVSRGFYFRPSRRGRLFCICDQESSDSLRACVDPEIQGRLAEVLWHELPAFRQAVQTDVWSCFRTFSEDGRPLIGPDPEIPGLYWAGALGGFGMGASWEVGRLAAQAIASGESLPQCSPARFDGR